MSEFSESYHLRGTSRRDAIELLERAGSDGFVFPALDGWVSFVAEGESFKLHREVVNANLGILLRWVYAEDHGWAFDVFKGQRHLIEYECSWEDDVEINGKVSYKDLQAALDLPLPALSDKNGLSILHPASIEEVFAVRPAYSFATALGLTNYRWLSHEYLARDAEKGHPLPLGIQRVSDA